MRYLTQNRYVFFGLLIGLLILPLPATAEEKTEDPVIQAAADEAVEQLEPDRGFLALETDVRSIKGLNMGIHGQSLYLKAAIEDLNADVRANETVVTLSADVLFDFDKALIKPEAKPQLTKLATILKDKKTSRAMIVGHTYPKGSDEYNQKLSEKRAQAVASWLATHEAINSSILTTKGAGEKEPVAPNILSDGTDSLEGRAKNRRVEITVKHKSS